MRRDVPRLNGLYASGQLELHGLVTEHFALDQVNDSLRYCEEGQGVRAVIEF